MDSNDITWRESKNKYSRSNICNKDANANARFRDMETLKYTLRAIEKNCPWYHKIYLITAGHSPLWLNAEHKKIVLVSHEELFIDKSHLPVFNSVAIEMNLVNLKGLSEKFVYMNDDFIIWNKLETSRFFRKGKPVDFFSHNFIPRNKLFELLKERDTWIHSINNILTLFKQKDLPIKLNKNSLYHKSYSIKEKINNYLFQNIFKELIWLNHWHHPQPLLKQTLHDVYDAFSEEMMISSKNRFRSNSDLNQYMYRYWQLTQRNFHPHRYNDDLIANIDSYAVLENLIHTLETKKHINFVCFNDSTELNNEEYDKVKIKLTTYLEARFPNKASFEY